MMDKIDDENILSAVARVEQRVSRLEGEMIIIVGLNISLIGLVFGLLLKVL